MLILSPLLSVIFIFYCYAIYQVFTCINCILQLSHGSSHGHSGVTNRGGTSVVGNPGFNSGTNGVGGSIPGFPASIGNRNAVPGLGVSPILGNAGSRITSSVGNMIGGGNIGRTGGGLSVPGLVGSRLNFGGNSGSGALGMQGQNRLMSSVLPQGVHFYSLRCSENGVKVLM